MGSGSILPRLRMYLRILITTAFASKKGRVSDCYLNLSIETRVGWYWQFLLAIIGTS